MFNRPINIEREKISVVTPTFFRPKEIDNLIDNLRQQTFMPYELIVIDGAPSEIVSTEQIVRSRIDKLPFKCRYEKHCRGTSIQRNAGIDMAMGDYIAFIDDDIRLEKSFFKEILKVFKEDVDGIVGGITGYITNQHLDASTSPRWIWYRRLRLFKTYEPGRYDFETGYPINRYLQPPHDGVKKIDFMGAGCAVWRREVFDRGLRFSKFFTDYGVLEDAHFALRAGSHWTLLECGRAHCLHLRSQTAKPGSRMIARKTAVNYRYVFVDLVPNRNWKQEFRFWLVQVFHLVAYISHAMRSGRKDHWSTVLGKLEGIFEAASIRTLSKK